VTARDSLDAALQSWAAPARPLLPSALMCAAEHHVTGALCSRLASVCDGNRSAHGEEPWHDTEERP
jgi:hypothetical protein